MTTIESIVPCCVDGIGVSVVDVTLSSSVVSVVVSVSPPGSTLLIFSIESAENIHLYI